MEVPIPGLTSCCSCLLHPSGPQASASQPLSLPPGLQGQFGSLGAHLGYSKRLLGLHTHFYKDYLQFWVILDYICNTLFHVM